MSKAELQEWCESLKYNKLVLVMSESAAGRYNLADLAETLEEKREVVWMKESVTYPTQETVLKGINRLREFEPEAILTIGGGSAIDFAKAMKVFYGLQNIDTIEDVTEVLEKKRQYRTNDIDIIAVPTTAGTGAEVTQWATIWDCDNRCKYSLDKSTLKPDVAIIVPELTVGTNAELTISTGLDSLAHAIEAYWSKKTSLLVRQLAKASIELTMQYLEKILEEPDCIAWREKQSLAAVLSGLAFSMTRTTACHSISYPLTMHYRVPHGIATAMTLAQVAEHNKGSYSEDTELMELFGSYGGLRGYLEEVCGNSVSLRLRDYGIAAENIKDIVEASFTLGRMDNNPKEVCKECVEEFLQRTL